MIRTITITFNETTPFVVTEGEKNSGELCWDEMLGQIVEMTHPSITHPPRYAMKTDKEWEAQRAAYRCIPPISGSVQCGTVEEKTEPHE